MQGRGHRHLPANACHFVLLRVQRIVADSHTRVRAQMMTLTTLQGQCTKSLEQWHQGQAALHSDGGTVSHSRRTCTHAHAHMTTQHSKRRVQRTPPVNAVTVPALFAT